MTHVEPVAQRLRAIMDTTPVVERAPIPQDAAVKLYRALRELCADTVKGLCDTDSPDVMPTGEDVLLATIAVAEAMAAQAALIQQVAWAKAAKVGITDTAVAKARGVTQQAHSKALKPSKKTQPK